MSALGQHREYVGVGAQTSSVAASHQSRKRESLVEVITKVDGRFLVGGGMEASAKHGRDDVNTVVLRQE